MKQKSKLIRFIAVLKLLKAASLIVVAIASFKLVHSDVAASLGKWIADLGIGPGHHYIDRALQHADNVSPDKMENIGIGSLIYAALFLTEGIGLWLLKRWAEWFTVIITSSLVPLEVYELYRHPTAIKVVVLLINLAVVGYLIHRIRTERSDSPS